MRATGRMVKDLTEGLECCPKKSCNDGAPLQNLTTGYLHSHILDHSVSHTDDGLRSGPAPSELRGHGWSGPAEGSGRRES